jgi:hypothetical protein
MRLQVTRTTGYRALPAVRMHCIQIGKLVLQISSQNLVNQIYERQVLQIM